MGVSKQELDDDFKDEFDFLLSKFPQDEKGVLAPQAKAALAACQDGNTKMAIKTATTNWILSRRGDAVEAPVNVLIGNAIDGYLKQVQVSVSDVELQSLRTELVAAVQKALETKIQGRK